MTQWTESDWEELLGCIDARSVIPVIGGELLQIQMGGGEVPLAAYLAGKLATCFNVDVPPDILLQADPIADVLDRVTAKGGARDDVYLHLNAILKAPLPTPAPLRQLADITPFDLFVSTTFDSLLLQALNEARFGGRPLAESLAFRLRRSEDLPHELRELKEPLVYHLFGRVSPMPDEYAVTEEDTLEFLHALAAAKQPERLFYGLNTWNLLLIGNRFPDWLALFFMRLAKGVRLSQVRGKAEIFADELSRRDGNLTLFFNRFKSNKVKIYPDGGAVAFVAELHLRYMRRHPDIGLDDEAVGEPDMELPPRPGAVFISYASEDRAAAEALHAGLTAGKVDAWLDRSALRPGDQWEAKIKQGIRDCAAFVAVISARTSDRVEPDHFFRREWAWAVGRHFHLNLPAGSTFLVPVIIDETKREAAKVPPEFLEAQVTRLPGGVTTTQFVADLSKLQKAYKRATRGFVRPAY